MGCLNPNNETQSSHRRKPSRNKSNLNQDNRLTEFKGLQNIYFSTLHGLSGWKHFWFRATDKVGIQNMTFFGKVQEINDLKNRVACLERKLENEIQLKETYYFEVERLQNDLRYVLNLAQENGFIDLIAGDGPTPSTEDLHGNRGEEPEPVPSCQTPCLASLQEHARQNGWQINKSEIELHEQIGKGATSDIFRGTWRGLDVAVKCISPDYFERNEEAVEWFCQEVEILARQRHPYVLQMMGVCPSPPSTAWLITELLSSRTVTEWMYGHKDRHKERSLPLPPLHDRLRIALEISQGMQYLHEQTPKVLHRDLKLSNILLDANHHVKIADFGHARFLADTEFALTGKIGTYVYMAPEVIRSQPYNEKCDVYSFAIILCELMTGQPPYIDSNYPPPKIAFEVAEGNLRPTLPERDETNEPLIDLVCCAWNPEPSERPSFAIITRRLRHLSAEIVG